MSRIFAQAAFPFVTRNADPFDPSAIPGASQWIVAHPDNLITLPDGRPALRDLSGNGNHLPIDGYDLQRDEDGRWSMGEPAADTPHVIHPPSATPAV